MYSVIGDVKKKSFKSQLINRAPFFASNMVLLIITLVSTRLYIGDSSSALYVNLSLPSTKRALHGSILRGR